MFLLYTHYSHAMHALVSELWVCFYEVSVRHLMILQSMLIVYLKSYFIMSQLWVVWFHIKITYRL